MTLLEVFNEVSVKPQNIKELKDLILDLAINGKFTKSKGWDHKLFSEVFDMKGGSQPPKSMFKSAQTDGYVQLFQIRDFGKKPIPVFVPKTSVTKFCSDEDVLIGRYGASIGKVFKGKEGAYNVALVKLIWERSLITQDYVYFLFKSPSIQSYFQNMTRSAQAGFNKKDMGIIPIPLPPIEEQKEIVRVVNELFQEIDNLSSKLDLASGLKENFTTSVLRELTTSSDVNQTWNALQQQFNGFFDSTSGVKKLRETILELAVLGKLTAHWRAANPNVEPASELLKRIEAEKQQLIAEKKIKKEKPLPTVGEDEIPFELPQGWAWSRFDEVILLQMGQSPPSISYNDEGIGEILINGPVEFSNGDHGITKEIKYTSAPTKMCNKGDLIVCIRASIGRTNIASNRACIGRGVASITSFIEFNYIHNYILINKATLFDLGTGTTFRSVSKDPIRNMLIPVPPLEEQKEIVRVVSSLMSLCDQLEEVITLKEEQAALLMKSCVAEALAW